MNPRTFRFDVRDGVGTILLTRPEKLNAITLECYAELRAFFPALASSEVRAIVLTGEGRAFCAGGDIDQIIGFLTRASPAERLEFTRGTCELVRSIRRLPRPVIAAVNGTCCGAGAVIAAACDIRLAVPSARFAYLFPKVGLCGADMGAAWLLPRIVGFGRASELLLTGSFIDAQEAYRIGLVNRVVPEDRLVAEAHSIAGALASGPSFAHAMTKEMLDRELSVGLEEALEMEAQAQALCMSTHEFQEAFRAWQAKRDPQSPPQS